MAVLCNGEEDGGPKGQEKKEKGKREKKVKTRDAGRNNDLMGKKGQQSCVDSGRRWGRREKE